MARQEATPPISCQVQSQAREQSCLRVCAHGGRGPLSALPSPSCHCSNRSAQRLTVLSGGKHPNLLQNTPIIAIQKKGVGFYMSAPEIQSPGKKEQSIAWRNDMGYNLSAPTYCNIWSHQNESPVHVFRNHWWEKLFYHMTEITWNYWCMEWY